MFEGNWNWVWHDLFMIWSLCVIWRSLNMKPRQFWKLSNPKDAVLIHQSDHETNYVKTNFNCLQTLFTKNSAQTMWKEVKLTRVIYCLRYIHLRFKFGRCSTSLLLLIPQILRTVWLKKCPTRFKKAEGMAEWDSISKNL